MVMTSSGVEQSKPTGQRVGFLERLHSAQRPVLVFDGATGTSLQQMNLTADDFGGAALEGCNENLVFTRPDAVQAVHRQFLDVGCDVIETDTFGAASIVLAEYDLEDQAFSINKRAAELAAITDPLKFGREIWKVESEVKVQTRKPTTQPERVVRGSAPLGASDATLERLRSEAERTGDYSKVFAYRKAQKQKRA